MKRHLLALSAGIARSVLLLILFGCATGISTPPAAPVRERISFNADWRFEKNDPAGAEGRLAYTNIKAWVTATGNEFTTNSQNVARPEGFQDGTPATSSLRVPNRRCICRADDSDPQR